MLPEWLSEGPGRSNRERLDVRNEPRWRVVASFAVCAAACAAVLSCSIPTMIGLWALATFTPQGPIRPMGLGVYMYASQFIGLLIGLPLYVLGRDLSRRPAAQSAAAVTLRVALAPLLFPIALFMIIAVRGLEIAS